jgi:hypothetical protein
MKATEVSLRVARAVSRAQIVLLSSHFERYFYTVNEEAVVFLNGNGVNASNLSETLKLLHSRMPIDDMAETGWENRTKKLSDFVAGDSWLGLRMLPAFSPMTGYWCGRLRQNRRTCCAIIAIGVSRIFSS